MHIGSSISHYRIVEKLGEGGMGVVYKAEDTTLERSVALKFLADHLLSDEEAKARFLREAKAAAALHHPNVCPVYEIAEADGKTFIAMAFLEGQALEDHIAEGPLSLNDALDIAKQVAEGLQAAHTKGIYHRDIKPANIIVSPEGRATIVDFGLARLTEASRLTKVDTAMGTVAYMSPEQAQGMKVDSRTDIWALGCVLYEMVSGQRPFKGEYDQAILYEICNEEPKALTGLRTGVPIELELLASKCLAKNPDDRYQSAKEVVVDLRTLGEKLKSVRSTILQPTHPTGVAALPRARRKLAYVAAGALVVGLLAAVAWISDVFRPSQSQPETRLQAMPFTSFEGSEQYPSISPDGSQVAFSWDGGTGQNFDIYVRVVGSGSMLQLTQDPTDDIAPAWSPDGRYVAFLRSRPSLVNQSVYDLYLVSPLGGPERRLTEAALSGPNTSGVGWSPDSQRVLFSKADQPGEPPGIHALTVDTEQIVRLTAPPRESIGDYQPQASPDGRTLAYVRVMAAGLTDIYSVPLSGGDPHAITSMGGRIRGIAWTPDGDEIVYSWGLLGQSPRLWRVSVRGSTPPQFLGVGEDGLSPVVSRQSRRLIYARATTDSGIWRYDVPAPGTEQQPPRRLIGSTRYERTLQIAPDGTRIAFVSNRSGNSEVWVAQSDGANPIQLTSSQNSYAGSPSWSPDGRTIAFDSLREGSWNIYTVSSQGGAARSIVVRDGNDARPSWSADGNWIYFGSNGGGTNEIWKAPAEGGESEQVTLHGGYHSAESSDGKFLYYGKRDEPGLWRMPVTGGDEVLVIEALALTDQGFWDLVEGGVCFIQHEEDVSRGDWALQCLRFDTGEVTAVADLVRPHEGSTAANPFDLAPDGTWFGYASTDQSDSDLMIVEEFR